MEDFEFSLEGEIWKDVVGYEGDYVVSNKGRVVVLNYRGKNKPHLLILSIKDDYCRVALFKGVRVSAKPHRVHRLVMAAFKGVSDLGIDHLNGIKTDNRLENLEYVTHRENVTRSKNKTRKETSHVGVNLRKDGRKKKWAARISIDKKCIHLGDYHDEKDAIKAYNIGLKIHNKGEVVTKGKVQKEMTITF